MVLIRHMPRRWVSIKPGVHDVGMTSCPAVPERSEATEPNCRTAEADISGRPAQPHRKCHRHWAVMPGVACMRRVYQKPRIRFTAEAWRYRAGQ